MKEKLMGLILKLILIIVIIIVCYLLMIMPRMISRPDFSPFKGWYYAHRGLYDNNSDAPENSLAAFKKAVENGYGIELDVQLTKDEVMVVCHDFDLNRVCNVDKKIRDLTYEELQQYTILDSDQHIPTFNQVLELVDGKVPMIIEYKIPGTDARVCQLADQRLSEYQGLYCIESFNPFGVMWYRMNRPEIVRGILSDSFVKEGYDDYPAIGYELLHHLLVNFIVKPDFIAYDIKYSDDLSRTLCQKLYKAPAVAWTLVSDAQLEDNRDKFDIFIFETIRP